MARTLALIPLLALFACDEETDKDTETVDTVDDTGEDSDTMTVAECGGDDVVILSGTILDDTTLDANCTYALRAGVFIGAPTDEPTDCAGVDSAVLTIPAGTTILGEAATNGMLVVNRCSQIVANGTADAPIVMTSSAAEGQRARGDWGGLIINGNAPTNVGDQAFGEGGTGFYGGTNAADNSGVLNYVRVEFAGTLISPENELNGIALQGVGSGTEVDYVQIHQNADDGIEFFGGTASAKHVLVTGQGDDSFDWTDGWVGNAQWVVLQQHEGIGDNGIEADNNGDVNDATPRSNPTISNITVVGQGNADGANAGDIGMLIREGTGASIYNAIITGFDEADSGDPTDNDPLDGGCIDIDQSATFTQATQGNVFFSSVRVDCEVNFDEADDGSDPFDVSDFLLGPNNNDVQEVDLSAARGAMQDEVNPDFGTDLVGGGTPSDAFFDESSVIGGVDAGDDWTAGWTAYPVN